MKNISLTSLDALLPVFFVTKTTRMRLVTVSSSSCPRCFSISYRGFLPFGFLPSPGMFPILAAVVAVATFTQLLAFTVMGERVTTRLRDMMFRATLRQDIAYFDNEENSTGTTERLGGGTPSSPGVKCGAGAASVSSDSFVMTFSFLLSRREQGL